MAFIEVINFMKFSIIVPCYNVEKWIEKCMESVLEQNYQDWEMILVNDGSTDNTINILNEYASRDERIQVIIQKNMGVSSARNHGISMARGEYLLFLDGDDWYGEKDGLSEIANSLENEKSDIVVFHYRTFDDGVGSYSGAELAYLRKISGSECTGAEYLMNVLSENNIYPWYPWVYAFKKELLFKGNIRFNPEFFILEDMDIIWQIILKAKRVRVLDQAIYSYRIRGNSVSHSSSVISVKQMLDVCSQCIEKVNALDVSDDLKQLLKNNFSYTYFSILKHSGSGKKEDRQAIFKLLYDNRELMNYTIRKKNVFIRKLTHILGLRITAELLFMRQKLFQKY